jgi:hypothetical protein
MGISVEVRPRQSFEGVSLGKRSIPSANTCQIIGIACSSVVPVPQGHNCVVFGVGFGEIIGKIIGLAARVKKENSIKFVAQLLAQFFCVFSLIGMSVVRG